jgi:hypothetical protein
MTPDQLEELLRDLANLTRERIPEVQERVREMVARDPGSVPALRTAISQLPIRRVRNTFYAALNELGGDPE